MFGVMGFARFETKEPAEAAGRRRLDLRRHDRAPAAVASSTPPIILAGGVMASLSAV
jgi:hypothetical protein